MYYCNTIIKLIEGNGVGTEKYGNIVMVINCITKQVNDHNAVVY